MKRVTILALHLGYGGIERAITDLANSLVDNYKVEIISTYKIYDKPVNRLDGKVKVKIEPGTQPGKVLRIRGKGLPSVNGYGTGDLLVNISIYVPETLSKDEKKALEKMEDSDNFKPNTSIKEKIFRKFKSLFD